MKLNTNDTCLMDMIKLELDKQVKRIIKVGESEAFFHLVKQEIYKSAMEKNLLEKGIRSPEITNHVNYSVEEAVKYMIEGAIEGHTLIMKD